MVKDYALKYSLCCIIFSKPTELYSPVILGSDGDTLDIRRRKEAGDDPTLTGMQ